MLTVDTARMREHNSGLLLNLLFKQQGLSRADLARVTGLSRPEAGRGNRALVAEGYATMLAPGWYQLAPAKPGAAD